MEKMSFWRFKAQYDIDKVISMIENDRNNFIKSGNMDAIISLMPNGQEISKNTVKMMDKEIEYSFIRIKTTYNCDREYYTDIVIYKVEDDTVKLNVFRGNKTTLNVIKPYFIDSKWEGISENKLNMDEDLLFWLFKSYLEFKDESLSKSDLIYINALKGYSGVTKDKGNKVKGEGERISEILGTLAFLLNNDPLKMIRPKIFYKYGNERHDILLEIKMTGTIRIDVKNYKGSFTGVYEYEELKAILSILCSEFIIHKLISSHQETIANDEWNISIKRDFLKRIGKEIQDRVAYELDKLSEQDKGKSNANDIEDEEEVDDCFDDEDDNDDTE